MLRGSVCVAAEVLDGRAGNPVPTSLCRALVPHRGCRQPQRRPGIERAQWRRRIAAVCRALPPPRRHSRGASDDSSMSRPSDRGSAVKRAGPTLLDVMASSLNIVQDRLTRSRLAGEPPDVMIAQKSRISGSSNSTGRRRVSRPAERQLTRRCPLSRRHAGGLRSGQFEARVSTAPEAATRTSAA